MRCHGLKGGIGSASRVVELDGKPYTIGALVLSNHAVFDDLVVAGTPIQTLLGRQHPAPRGQRLHHHGAGDGHPPQ